MSHAHGGARPSWRLWRAAAASGREQDRRLVRVWRHASLLTRFTVIGLLFTFTIGLVLGGVVSYELERSSLELAAESLGETVRVEIDPFLRTEDFAGVPSPERLQAIDLKVRETLREGRVVKINLWNPSGMVVYSTDSSLVGRQFPIDAELADALKGEIGMDISDLSREENRKERARFTRLMEIYVPVRIGGGSVVGAYEVYRRVDGILRMVANTQRLLWIGLGSGLSILYLALFGVVRAASRQLRRQSEELGRVEARRVVDKLTTEFVSIVSHELRTPLTALVGFTELLLTQPVDEAERREWTENMHAAAKRLTKMVEDLLDVSRIEDGRIELKPQPVDVKAAVNLVLADFRVHTPAHRLEQRCGEAIPPVLADPDKLTQILTNLTSNAIKYSPQGGAITISVTAADGTVRVSVADQGLGLARDELPRLFERFHRVQDETRRQIPGTGLGLYITRRLVELQDGRIWADSAGPGKGSTFHVELPAASGGKENG
ncbi:MAG TPA: HAMP domain-containing sensor histidine kinase [Candidatus Methylomirabilis sp.]|nr:HAMP domain-containing sensor histidine kinase [Candidatus Methylomirabilis sp.]